MARVFSISVVALVLAILACAVLVTVVVPAAPAETHAPFTADDGQAPQRPDAGWSVGGDPR